MKGDLEEERERKRERERERERELKGKGGEKTFCNREKEIERMRRQRKENL